MNPPRSVFRDRRDRRPVEYAAKAIAAGIKQTPGTLGVCEVRHDPGCRRPQGGSCTCNPDVIVRPLYDPVRR